MRLSTIKNYSFDKYIKYIFIEFYNRHFQKLLSGLIVGIFLYCKYFMVPSVSKKITFYEKTRVAFFLLNYILQFWGLFGCFVYKYRTLIVIVQYVVISPLGCSLFIEECELRLNALQSTVHSRVLTLIWFMCVRFIFHLRYIDFVRS